MTFPVFPGSNPSGYNLTRSLRVRSSAGAYLSRTPSSTGNRQVWTYSLWVKRGALSSARLFDTGYIPNTSNLDLVDLYFNGDNIGVFMYDSATVRASCTTTAVYRDPAAWYHIVFSIDTTQATASNRIKVYVNNVLQSFSSATYPSQNYNTFANTSGVLNAIGRYLGNGLNPDLDAYITEVNFIDGQALTPSSFGSTNATTGVWQPARYTGTYGTNGFYLPFTDNSALTTSSNVGLGKDFSGNGNYWTTNNISITSGTTYDSMTDVPTLTSATASNYCTLNPLLSSNTITFSQANLSAVVGATSSVYRTAGGTIAVNSGKWYFEDVYGGGGNCNAGVGEIAQSKSTWESDTTVNTAFWFVQGSTGNKINGDGGGTSYGSAFSTNDIIMVAVDVTNGKIWWGKNGTWFASGDPATAANPAFTNLTGKNITPAFFGGQGSGSGGTHTPNFGQRPFAYTPPTGFVALNTYNLPTSTIVKGNTVMDATLYTGNGGASQAITNAGAFKPDFVWVKDRSVARNNNLLDSVRGATNGLFSNLTSAEVSSGYLSSFNSNGFTVGNDVSTNGNGETFVGWQWQAGQGTTSSNTNGSITSTVSVNATAGFSILTYTGNGSTGSIGHGLGVTPSLVIIKNRNNGASSWPVFGNALGSNYMTLNSTSAASAGWTSVSSSLITFNSYSSWTTESGSSFVAYCWTPIAGYSAFGSYTGNGSTDGPFVYFGFRPKFVLIKRTDSAESWVILDSARNTYNVVNEWLFPNLSDSTYTYSTGDFLSSGIKLRNTGTGTNASGGTYIYAAYAENPFKNALAR